MANKSLPGNKSVSQGRPAGTGKPGRPKKNAYKCCSCGTEYTSQEGNFSKSSSDLFAGNNGHVPFCMECIEKYYMDKLLPALEYDERRSIEMICAICDWIYDDDAFDMAKKAQEATGGIMTSLYAGRRRLRSIKLKGDTYLDTIIKRREDAARLGTSADIDVLRQEAMEKPREVDPAIVKLFGTGYSPDEYDFLDEQYRDWTDRYDCQTKAQEELFKNLSVAQLNIRIAQESRHAKSSAEAFKAFRELMDTAKITPKQNGDDTLAETNTFGTLIKKWEDERPIPQPAPEWEDVDGIKKYMSTWFFGHLCKMFKIDNDYTRAYDEEISKFTVDAPVVAEDDDEEIAEKYSDVFNSANRTITRPAEE